jgi:hypothetical protein
MGLIDVFLCDRQSPMGVAVFRTHPRAGFTANAVIGIGDRHHLAFNFFAFILVHKLTLFIESLEMKDISAAGFETAPTADAFDLINLLNKLGNPNFAPKG